MSDSDDFERRPPAPVPDASTTEEPGQKFDEGEGRIFPCDRCGADLTFNIGVQKLTCEYCGYVKEIELQEDAVVAEQDFHQMLARLREWREQAQRDAETGADAGAGAELVVPERRELRCDSCGGNVEFVGTLTSTHCPYCGSPVQLENAHKCEEHRIPVDGVLPFQIERETAARNLKEWVASRWFAPNAFRRQGVEGRFNGVYLAYFTFDAMTFTVYVGRRGEYYWVEVGTGDKRRRVRRTRWYPASGRFQRFFDDVLVLANTGLNRKFMLKLEPWPLNKVVPFTQQVLAGCMARTYDIELDECFVEGKERMDAAIYAEVKRRIGGDTQQVTSVKSRYDGITYKHLLLPVWLLAYHYRDKTYQVFINAATGEVQGERPYSVWKILFAVLVGALVVGLIAMASN